jgi:hypothetical protein
MTGGALSAVKLTAPSGLLDRETAVVAGARLWKILQQRVARYGKRDVLEGDHAAVVFGKIVDPENTG